VGKTTLAQQISSGFTPKPVYLDLESQADLARLREPELYFERHSDRLVILDEVQRAPELFAQLRGVVDRRRRSGQKSGQFLVLGSASLELLRQSSESLAGRIAYIHLAGLSPIEVKEKDVDRLWLRGGFPDSYLSESDQASMAWRLEFIRTYLERDIPQLGPRVPAATLRRFWTMLAHLQGSTMNLSRIASSLGVSVPTVGRYVDLLEDLLLVRQLRPWTANIGKRLVKTPKVYVRDSGIVHALLQISNQDELLGHPVAGASWEGFIIESLLSELRDWTGCGFYRTAAGAEIDIFIELGTRKRIAIEVKRSLTPRPGKGFLQATKDLKATHRIFVYPGKESYPIGDQVQVMTVVDAMRKLRELAE
jgi:hypothetical protein